MGRESSFALIPALLLASACASHRSEDQRGWYSTNCQENYACATVPEENLAALRSKTCHELLAQGQRNREQVRELSTKTKKEDASGEKLAEIALYGVFVFPPSLALTLPALAVHSALRSPEGKAASELERQTTIIHKVYDEKKCRVHRESSTQ